MKPYEPDKLPLRELDFRRLFALLGDASAELARYDGLLRGVVNPAIMLSPLTDEEAVMSSRIEGTRASMSEVLEHEAGLLKEGEKFKDIQEIINYRKALQTAREYLVDRPLTLAFVRELHKILMDSARGRDKAPGEFRKNQNWIGAPGCGMAQATFVPPDPLQLPAHMRAWQKYLESDDIDALLQAAVMHAQFEILHPFKDGNGRIGRILIPLFLYKKGVISQPMFYLSAYLEAHREEYYAGLRGISRAGDWNGWIAYFLRAVAAQARADGRKVQAILLLYERMKTEIHAITRSQYVVHLLDAIFARPVFEATDFPKKTGIRRPTALMLLRKLKAAGVLAERQPGSGRRSAVLIFPELLDIVGEVLM